MPLIDYSLWRQAPFVRMVIPLMAGIITSWELALEVNLEPFTIFLIFTGLFIACIVVVNIKTLSPVLKSAFLILLLFMMGGFLTVCHDATNHSNFAGKYLNESSSVILRMNEPLSEKPASWKAEADILKVKNGNHYSKSIGKAILYFKKTDTVPPLHYGDVIISSNQLQPIRNSGNPGSFDYERYCHLHNIFYQGFLPKNSWIKLPVEKKNFLQNFFIESRSRCNKILSRYIFSSKELGIAEALLVGYRDNLDKDLVQDYANTGVAHVIAISGLHLGLIYLILLFLLKPLKRKGYQRWIKGSLLILSLWCFAMITGGAPSALRACVMFSFIVMAKFFVRRQANIYNTLAASAFLLLCYNPFLLFDVGFQLSYLAVLGIVMFQKPVFALGISDHKPWNYIWKMMSVSTAAELLTFPIAIYYFHRFPVTFLVANLLVVPLASFILYGEVILIAVSFIHPVGSMMGWVITKSIILMNGVIAALSPVTISGFSEINYSLIETILLYAVVLSLVIFLLKKIKFAFPVFLFFFLLFSVSRVIKSVGNSINKKIVVYNVPGFQALDLIDRQGVNFLGDSMVLQNKNIIKNTLLPSRIHFQSLSQNNRTNLLQQNPFIQFYNTKIFIMGNEISLKDLKRFYPVDYVIISHNPDPDFQLLKNIFSPKMVIFDGSNPLWKTKQWKTACDSLHLRCFSVQEEGAWVKDVQ